MQGKSLWTADTLSRSPVTSHMSIEELGLMENTSIYTDYDIENLPVSPPYMENLKEQLKADNVSCTCYRNCMKDIRVWRSAEAILVSLCGGLDSASLCHLNSQKDHGKS